MQVSASKTLLSREFPRPGAAWEFRLGQEVVPLPEETAQDRQLHAFLVGEACRVAVSTRPRNHSLGE